MDPEQRLERERQSFREMANKLQSSPKLLSMTIMVYTHLHKHGTTILEVEWLYRSQLIVTVGSKTSKRNADRSQYRDMTTAENVWLLNLHSVPNWNFVFACVDLAIHWYRK